MRLTINDFNFEKAIARQGVSYTGNGNFGKVYSTKANKKKNFVISSSLQTKKESIYILTN